MTASNSAIDPYMELCVIYTWLIRLGVPRRNHIGVVAHIPSPTRPPSILSFVALSVRDLIFVCCIEMIA